MTKKYKLLKKDKIFINGKTLYRIQALRNFGNVKKGDIGGYIEKDENLSHKEKCWCFHRARIFDRARVFGDALVFGDAEVSNDARVFDRARVFGDALVFDRAQVFNDARVFGDALVFDRARIFDLARVSGNARVFNDALVYGDALVFDRAEVSNDARVFDRARVFGDALVFDRARVSDNARIYGNARVFNDATMKENYIVSQGCIFATKNLSDILVAQTGIPIIKGKAILFKRVNKISEGKYSSIHDSNFLYEDNKIAQVLNPDTSTASCASGIHLSNATYWNRGDTLIACEVREKDIITIQEGKARVKACKVIGEV